MGLESFGLFDFLKNMLPFFGDNVNKAETPTKQNDGNTTAENDRTEKNDAPTSAPTDAPSASREAILQFMSSHETRSKRIKK